MTDELSWTAGWRMQELIRDRQLSPVEVVEHFLGRAEELDTPLRCYRELDPDGARAQAKQAEQAVRLHDDLGPLHGYLSPSRLISPVARASICTPCSANPSLPSSPRRDAPVVARLQTAGAIVMGTDVIPDMGLSHLQGTVRAARPPI